jgi:DNA-binding transcriptional ArsR family regulator
MTTRDFARATEGLSVLQALADPVRIAIVRQLAACGDAEIMCGALNVDVGKSTATHHIRTLVRVGVISERVQGRRKFLRLRRADLDARFPGLLDAALDATS